MVYTTYKNYFIILLGRIPDYTIYYLRKIIFIYFVQLIIVFLFFALIFGQNNYKLSNHTTLTETLLIHTRTITSIMIYSACLTCCLTVFSFISKFNFRFLFTSANLNLAELIGLRPDLGKLKKILYFHENQLVYPVRKKRDRDFQYGYNQIVSW